MSDRTGVARAVPGSRVVGLASRLRAGLQTVTRSSKVVDESVVTARRTVVAGRRARLTAALSRLWTATRRSWLARRLTDRTDPTLGAVTLAETRTIGPVVALLGWLERQLRAAVGGSRLRTAGSHLRDTRVSEPLRAIGLLTILLGATTVLGLGVLGFLTPILFGGLVCVLAIGLALALAARGLGGAGGAVLVRLARALFEPPALPDEPLETGERTGSRDDTDRR